MISRKVDYALRGLLYLAQQPKKAWISTAKVSEEMRVSSIFLAKIFQTLTTEKIIESRRGRAGGIRLVKRSTRINEIIKMFDPTFAFNKCLGGRHRCFMQKKCQFHKILYGLQHAFFNKLSKVTLASISK